MTLLNNKKQLQMLLTAVNSSPNMFKYPVGNETLTQLLKDYEAKAAIVFNKLTMKWEKIKNGKFKH